MTPSLDRRAEWIEKHGYLPRILGLAWLEAIELAMPPHFKIARSLNRQPKGAKKGKYQVD